MVVYPAWSIAPHRGVGYAPAPDQKKNPYGWVSGRGGKERIENSQQPKPMRRGSFDTFAFPHAACSFSQTNG
jgi:hypothetical protein